MGLMINGQWTDQSYDTSSTGGRFVRADTTFRDWVVPIGAKDGASSRFVAEKGRYHLYLSLACPWAHRAIIMRNLKSLQSLISLSVVNWLMLENGCTFNEGPGVIPDPVLGARYLHEIYTAAHPTYSGRVTVPVLWDRKHH